VNTGAQRLATGLIGAPIVLVAAWFGGWPFALVVCIAAVVAQYELYTLAGLQRYAFPTTAGLLSGVAIVVRAHVGASLDFLPAVAIVVLVGSIINLHGRGNALVQGGIALAGVMYPTAMLSLLAVIRASEAAPGVGREITLLTIIGVWAADTVAYYFGRRFGRRSLSRASPGKTWEGFAGGVVGAVAVVAGLSAWIGPLGPFDTLFVGIACGVVGPVGDVAESALKRSVEAKDSGVLLPGHGGLLDRIDALVVVSPLVYGWAILTGTL